MMRKLLSASLLAVLAGFVQADELTPARNGDFAHYTFALAWMPGFCQAGGEGCLPDQNQSELIGLHGLWASEPQSLADKGVAVSQWWEQGCSLFPHVTMVPALSEDLRQRLKETMPQLASDLQTHEYVKHAQCFGFDANEFFTTALQLREAALDSDFGRYLQAQAGRVRNGAELKDAFAKGYNGAARGALQLRCAKDAKGRNVLTELWFTLKKDKLESFPESDSFMDTPAGEREDTCGKPFLLPRW
ncbi:ribonuclease I [Chromobacterium phragmitis]|uniref:ribonuclease T2 family protein n=1 Tax=Chromobacterium phragmitis TaxID=2202141 RepID=UPI000DEC6AE5|nr:ribonuclease I [Chromobacterium phragmitis]AXE30617.1 ribonuclease I [Chromobacterium phragmitis]